ncbi:MULTISPECIES: CotH kinase family protein [unclassified Micromonospora]|uniref:CotH kinase family protein n=1 Tax=unclassified Micromonospora TaxID=2617518 RepID=UPI00098D6A60|nr:MULTISPECIES: CotH kinase family protein [unclassified Micromonospora]OON29568.1 spore coat protein CotH [Micromonospora sp. Rc5]
MAEPPRARSPLPRALRRRLPARVRQNWKLLTTCAAFLAVLTLVLGTERIRPYVTSAGDTSADTVTVDIAGTTDLFDAGVAHSISLTFADADYQRMLETYWKEGEKEYVEADLTVDGTTLPSVGIRLKGNSTLQSLTWKGESRPRGTGAGPAGGMPNGGGRPTDAGQRQGGQQTGQTGQQGDQQTGQQGDQTGQQTGQRQAGGGFPGGGMTRTSLKAEEPETLPWLISFDEFVDGRRYQGHREVAVRVAGMGGGSTVLNEALSLSLLDSTGEAAQRYAYSSFTVNDRPTTARLLVEHPDENFADQMGGTGVLYKSLASSSFTDQGDDQTDYTDDFKQITMKGSQDLQPVINLIRWVNSASDEEFDAQLADRVDVDSFARYVALQNLLLNFDDMSGPGKNYYLWYDLETKKFSVISWDHNLTFSGNASQGPHDSGGFGMRGGGQAPGGTQPQDGAQLPEGMQLPEGAQLPEGRQPPGGGATEQEGGEAGPVRMGGMMTGHKLKERFLASDAFKEVYEDAYRELYQQVYASGRATGALDAITGVLKTVDGVDAAAVDSDAERLRTLVQQRTESLKNNEVITRS